MTQSDAGGSRLPQLEPKAESAAPNGTCANIGDVDEQQIGGEQKPGASSGGEPNSSAVEIHEVKPEDTHLDNGPVKSDELARPGSLDLERDMEINDSFDPNSSVSSYSNNELGRNPSTPSGEYFDAFEGMFLHQISLVSDMLFFLVFLLVCVKIFSICYRLNSLDNKLDIEL